MSAPADPSAPARPRAGWLAGPLTLVLLATFGVLLGASSAATSLPTTRASAFVPLDATRGKVTLHRGDAAAPAELSDARLTGATVRDGVPSTTVDAAVRLHARPGATWFRESVTTDDGSLPARIRLHAVDDQGVWLVAEDGDGPGLVLDGLLELPAAVAPGQSWTSSGAALAQPSDGTVRFVDRSRASTPADPARAAEGCLEVESRTDLVGARSTAWVETRLWCPAKGVVSGSGTLGGRSYAVTSGGAASPVGADELVTPGWDTSTLASWRVRARGLVAGAETDGLVAGTAATLPAPGSSPVVAASGAVAYPTLAGADLVGLVPHGTDLWAHWWARPGGQVTSLATTGDLVVAATTGHRVSAYRLGGTLVWTAPLDDVAVAPPLPTGQGVAVATVGGTLSVLDARTGTPRWTTRVGAGVHAGLASGAGLVVTADAGSSVTAWDLGTGAQRWQVSDVADAFATSVLVSGDEVVVVSGSTVSAYAAADGHRRWVRQAALGAGSAALVGGQLWLGVDGDLHAWSVADGRELWTRPGAVPVTNEASRCDAPAGAGLARAADRLVALAPDGSVREAWTLPATAADDVTVGCRGAGVDVTVRGAGDRGLQVLRLAVP